MVLTCWGVRDTPWFSRRRTQSLHASFLKPVPDFSPERCWDTRVSSRMCWVVCVQLVLLGTNFDGVSIIWDGQWLENEWEPWRASFLRWSCWDPIWSRISQIQFLGGLCFCCVHEERKAQNLLSALNLQILRRHRMIKKTAPGIAAFWDPFRQKFTSSVRSSGTNVALMIVERKICWSYRNRMVERNKIFTYQCTLVVKNLKGPKSKSDSLSGTSNTSPDELTIT